MQVKEIIKDENIKVKSKKKKKDTVEDKQALRG